jgi:hypothetical protein
MNIHGQLNFEIIYSKGNDNSITKALSRQPDNTTIIKSKIDISNNNIINLHNSSTFGNPGITQTVLLVHKLTIETNLKEIKKVIKTCCIRQRFEQFNTKNKINIKPFHISKAPYTELSIDIAGPITQTLTKA